MEMHHQNSPPQLQTSIFVPFSSLGTLIISRSVLRLSQDLFFERLKKKHFSKIQAIAIETCLKNPLQNEPKKGGNC